MSIVKNKIYDVDTEVGLNRNNKHGNKIHLCGLWRGICEDNRDPSHVGRIKVRIFGLHGDDITMAKEDLPWANACVPGGGGSDYGVHDVPEIGASVWIMFEQGNTDFPVWVGCWTSNPGVKVQVPST